MINIVHIAIIEHQTGQDCLAATDEATLTAEIAKYCRDNWHACAHSAKIQPDSDDLTVDLYFDDHQDDSLTTHCVPVAVAQSAPEEGEVPIQLRARYGELCYPDGSEILLFHPSGDCDSICWPCPQIGRLRLALFDARESGKVKNGAKFLLPDKREFDIDAPFFKPGDLVQWHDPDDNVCSRTGTLTGVDMKAIERLWIQMDGEWEAEVLEDELELLNTK